MTALVRFRSVALTLVVAALLGSPAWAGKYNRALSIGDAAPEWKDLPGTDGERYSLADLAKYDVVVIAFTCNTCEYSIDYEERLQALHKQLSAGGRAVLVAINPNQIKEDLLPAMKERAETRGLDYLYLHDDTQEVAKSYGATWTPEFVVLNKDRKVVYLGAMDDNPELKKEQTTKYVEAAVAAALDGKTPEVAETPGVGCLVRYVRERRKKK
jgi:peroxiredoxin